MYWVGLPATVLILLLTSSQLQGACQYPSIENGEIEPKVTPDYQVNGEDYVNINTKVWFFCDDGYRLSGSNTSVCGNRFLYTWDPPLPHCLRVICSALNLANGTIYYLKSAIDGGYQLHTVAYFFCHSAYYRSGTFNSICTITGDWDVQPPICNPITCPALNLSNGVVRYNKPPFNNTEYVVGTVALFSCNIIYYISQNISRTCQLSGMWTQQTPICHIRFCSYIHLPYGHVRYSQPAVKGKFPFHSTVAFWCIRGYRRVGERGFFCGLNGWDGEVPDSVPITCEALQNLSNGVVSYSNNPDVNGSYVVDTIASFSCNPGYSIDGPGSRTCNTSGIWNETTPICNRVPPPPPPACFPSSARVNLENGKSITMSQLQKGDKVETVSEYGTVLFSEVRTFLKNRHTMTNKYKSITTSRGNTLHLTENHLIYTQKSYADKIISIYADQVNIGDIVFVSENGQLTKDIVINVSSSIMQGVYIPLTMDGNIMVNGVLTSCYASYDHDVAHIALTPVRYFPEMTEWIFGFQGYVSIAEELSGWLS